MSETKRYRVENLEDDIYQVLEQENPGSWEEEDDGGWERVYQGSLSDCEAYIRLHENGYM